MAFRLHRTRLATYALFAGTLLTPGYGLAHTDSLGFIISDGSGADRFDVTVYYGSWHPTVGQAEGSLDLYDADSNLVDNQAFTLVPGFNGVADGTVPDGLVAGENYFWPDECTPETGDLSGDASCQGDGIFAFQSVLFSDILAGAYTFGYDASSSLSQDWEPSDPAINNGSFAIGADGGLVSVGGATPDIDTSQGSYTTDELSNDAVNPTFDGGTLQVTTDAGVTNDFTVTGNGGTIDTNGHDSTFSGAMSGNGTLNKRGNGTLTLTGDNSGLTGDTVVHAGTLAFSGDDALGGASASLVIGDATAEALGGGTLTHDIRFAATDGTSVFDTGANDVTLSGAVGGSSCLTKNGSGRLDLRSDGANDVGARVHEGELAFNAGFDGNVWVDGDGTMGGSGHVRGDISVTGTLAPGNSPGTLTVTGSVTQMDGSNYVVEIDGYGTGTGAGNYDRVLLTGANSVYTADGTITAQLRGIPGDAENTFSPAVGDLFRVVEAEGGVTGTYDTLVQPAAGLPADTRFVVLYNPNDVTLAVTPQRYADTVATNGRNNAVAAARALDGIRPVDGANADDGVTGALFTRLAGLSSEGITQAFEQTAADIHPVAMTASRRARELVRDGMIAHATSATRGATGALTHGTEDAATTPEGLVSPSGLWVDVAGEWTHVDDDNATEGYGSRTGAIYGGLDLHRSDTARFGIGVGVADTDVWRDDTGSADLRSYQLLAYGRIAADNNYLAFTAGGSDDRYETSRHVDLAAGRAKARSDVDGHTLSLDLEAGHSVHLDSVTLTPRVGFSAERARRDGFTEDGDPAVTVSQDGYSEVVTQLRVGMAAEADVQAFGHPMALRASADWHYTPDDDRLAPMTNTLHGASWSVRAPDAGEHTGSAALQARLQLGENLTAYFGSRVAASGDAVAGRVQGGLTLLW
ncbi:hypothetical protein KBTX_00462 [wastewater metagenome]|uniref:Autotransporter domain-containing protein n=5 Tax=root TaxID=1 RepID=A0A5B8R5N0_9ZZZZ|nr:hypothetical protein KBTEX_00462 [uncultured organism]